MASDELTTRIEQEGAKLAAVPKLPITAFLTLHPRRCHICGKVCDAANLSVFETQATQFGPLERMACTNCHPQRGAM